MHAHVLVRVLVRVHVHVHVHGPGVHMHAGQSLISVSYILERLGYGINLYHEKITGKS